MTHFSVSARSRWMKAGGTLLASLLLLQGTPLLQAATPASRKPAGSSSSSASRTPTTRPVAGMVTSVNRKKPATTNKPATTSKPASSRKPTTAQKSASNKKKPTATAQKPSGNSRSASSTTARAGSSTSNRSTKPSTARKPSTGSRSTASSSATRGRAGSSSSRSQASAGSRSTSSRSSSRSQSAAAVTAAAEPIYTQEVPEVVETAAEPEPPRRSFLGRVLGAPFRILGFGRSSAPAAEVTTVEANLPWTVVESSANGTKMSGIASWYGGYWHGRKTANGERYDQNSLTAAHRTLPFNTLVKVTNQRNGRSVVVRINNRGPHIRGRVLDLSVAAAKQIGSHSGGLAPVEGVVIGRAVR